MYLDFAADHAAFGGYVRLEANSCWAAVVGLGPHPLVALRDDELPPHRGLDVRTDGLWTSLTCETPGEHWSAGMEAFAVGYDDPAGALGDERGDIVALGLDLEWEREGDLWRVHGEVLLGDDRHAIDTYGSTAWATVSGRAGNDALVTDDLSGIEVHPRWPAPVKAATGPVERALCTLTTADGRNGVAWVG